MIHLFQRCAYDCQISVDSDIGRRTSSLAAALLASQRRGMQHGPESPKMTRDDSYRGPGSLDNEQRLAQARLESLSLFLRMAIALASNTKEEDGSG
jgi:hypothetical protein